MSLSNDLISEFVKMTNDSSKQKNTKTTSYGTIVEKNGVMYVKLDGSTILTPVDSTSMLHENDRVVVDINNHTAIVSGNISNPSVSNIEMTELEDKVILHFKDGYHEGITSVDEDGIVVLHTSYGGSTKMRDDGFYLNNGKGNTLKCTSDGIFYTGTITASDIESLDGTFKIDKNGNIIGANLKKTKGGNFYIDENGDITGKKFSIEDEVSSNMIICNNILNKAYPKTLTGSVNLYVNKLNGNDENTCINESVFKTCQSAIDSIPKFLNGKTVNIHIQNDIVQNIKFEYFYGGKIYIYLNGHNIYGTVECISTVASLYFYGGDTINSNTYGAIHPSNGVIINDKSSSVYIEQTKDTAFNYINIYSPDYQANNVSGYGIGLYCKGEGYVYCDKIKIFNCDVGFSCNNGCQLHMNSSSGIAQSYGFQAKNGGKISFSDTSQIGGNKSATYQDSGGQIWMNNCMFNSGSITTDSNKALTTTLTILKVFTANSAQALQYAGASNSCWRTDCKPKIGDYGYGAHTGWWFFGDSFESVSNKEVSKIEIIFLREKTGYSGTVVHTFYIHEYEDQPITTSPEYSQEKIASISSELESTNIITITDKTIINRIKNAKGICCIPSTQSNENYSVMSAVMKVKFTYKD